MRKSEMSAQQLKTYTTVRKELTDLGFELDDGKWFEKDISAESEIEGTFHNGDMELILEYAIKDDLFTLTLIDDASGMEAIFDLFPENKLSAVLTCIDSFKGKVNGNNFQEHINQLVKVCPKVFTYRNDKAFRLKPNDD